MLETENKASVEARTCVTCGKIFYVDLDDEKMRAAKGFGPKRECSECMQARMQLIEEQTRRNRETEESRLSLRMTNCFSMRSVPACSS